MIRVALADDHTIFRQGLAAMLRADGEIDVVGEASDVLSLIEVLQATRPDVAVVDVSMPGPDVTTLPVRLSERGLSVRLVALTMHAEVAIVRRVLAAGFQGYVLKDNSFDELLDALRTVAAGDVFVSPVLEAQLRREPEFASLSEREQTVLRWIADGSTTKRIAAELGISAKTVETYRTRLMRKLDVRSSAELVRRAIELGLLPTS
jgi:DNA-binding NarL/FixJ family response regulator